MIDRDRVLKVVDSPTARLVSGKLWAPGDLRSDGLTYDSSSMRNALEYFRIEVEGNGTSRKAVNGFFDGYWTHLFTRVWKQKSTWFAEAQITEPMEERLATLWGASPSPFRFCFAGVFDGTIQELSNKTSIHVDNIRKFDICLIENSSFYQHITFNRDV